MKRLLPTSHFLAIILLMSGSLYALMGNKAEAYEWEEGPYERSQRLAKDIIRDMGPSRSEQMQREMLEMEIGRQQYQQYCNQITNNPRAQQACFDSMY